MTPTPEANKTAQETAIEMEHIFSTHGFNSSEEFVSVITKALVEYAEARVKEVSRQDYWEARVKEAHEESRYEALEECEKIALNFNPNSIIAEEIRKLQTSEWKGEDTLQSEIDKLGDWNDSLRQTIERYLNDQANRDDLKRALTQWTNRPNPEWTADMMKALERAVKERDEYRTALEKIGKHIAKETPDGWVYTELGGERCPAYQIALAALSPKEESQ